MTLHSLIFLLTVAGVGAVCLAGGLVGWQRLRAERDLAKLKRAFRGPMPPARVNGRPTLPNAHRPLPPEWQTLGSAADQVVANLADRRAHQRKGVA
jgi:hypothetical protein